MIESKNREPVNGEVDGLNDDRWTQSNGHRRCIAAERGAQTKLERRNGSNIKLARAVHPPSPLPFGER